MLHLTEQLGDCCPGAGTPIAVDDIDALHAELSAKKHSNTRPQMNASLSVDLQRALINFADPAYAAFPGLAAEKVQGGLDKDIAARNALGCDAKLCLTDFGETAAAVQRWCQVV